MNAQYLFESINESCSLQRNEMIKSDSFIFDNLLLLGLGD